ncbi:MAG: hypothetical protein NZM13_07360 [Cyclobacteriaceae bacterium]|nr:hypothetical protein [Cyclobacteriaceae bacterium]MDW8330982.1 hypothetical protein [Cyclobacteriaceae bacterium]
MRQSLILIFFFLPLFIPAQHLREVEGVLVFNNQQVFSGRLEICPDLNLIARLSENGRQVVPLHTVHRLYFFDAEENLNRRFSVVASRHARTANLCEIVVDGAIQILRKKLPRTSGADNRYHYRYILNFQSQEYDIWQFRTALYPVLLKQHGLILKDYIRMQHLSPNDPGDIIRIVQFVNALEYLPDNQAAFVENKLNYR